MKKALRTAVLGLALMASLAPVVRADDQTYDEDSRQQVWQAIRNDIDIGTFVDFYVIFTLEVGYWLGW